MKNGSIMRVGRFLMKVTVFFCCNANGESYVKGMKTKDSGFVTLAIGLMLMVAWWLLLWAGTVSATVGGVR